MPLNVLITTAALIPEAGGPARTVGALAKALGELGDRVRLVTSDYGPASGSPLIPPKAWVETVLVPGRYNSRLRLLWAPDYDRVLTALCRDERPDVIHDNGLWLQNNHAASRVSGLIGCPFVVSPRGMLTSWSLRHKAFKKKLAWWLYQRRDLERAALLHATSPEEREDLRRLGFRQPIAVIPNGVDLPSFAAPLRERRAPGNPRSVVFLSRIHPKKGLRHLVQAWSELRPEGWTVTVAGPDELDHRAELEREIAGAGLSEVFRFIGEVDDHEKWNVLRAADLFVLPSHSENFGVVVAEALASGVPVITTRGTPWADLEARKCGWWVDIGAEPLCAALRDALSLDDDERAAMGLRGRALVEERFGWPPIARSMHAAYAWIRGGGPPPGCVS
jgi:glycosyltransferase involved in cell wall biosynthesis